MLRVGRLPDHGYIRAAYILPEKTYQSASPGAFGTDPIQGCLAGGMGYAKEYHAERWLREIWIARIAPVSWQLALSFIAEKELDLPKSY